MIYRTDHTILVDDRPVVYRTYVKSCSYSTARSIGRAQVQAGSVLRTARSIVYCAGFTVEVPGVTEERKPAFRSSTDA